MGITNMIKNSAAVLALCVGLSVPSFAFALDSLTYDLDREFSGATAPVGSTPWATATFMDQGDDILLILDAVNLTGQEFISSWYFNYNDLLDVSQLSISAVGGDTGAVRSISEATDAYKADGGGYFDVKIKFNWRSNQNQFTNGESISFLIQNTSGLNLNPEDFLFMSANSGGNGPLYTAAHVQAINSTDSGWITGEPDVQVPEPMSLVFASTLLSAAAARRRRNKK